MTNLKLIRTKYVHPNERKQPWKSVVFVSALERAQTLAVYVTSVAGNMLLQLRVLTASPFSFARRPLTF